MNRLSYKGFMARVEFDAEDGLFVGHLAGIADIVGFHADNVGDLVRAFHESVDDYIATCAKAGKTPEKPYSGRLMLRIAPDTHAAAALAAQVAGKSLNQWSEEVLRARAEQELAAS